MNELRVVQCKDYRFYIQHTFSGLLYDLISFSTKESAEAFMKTSKKRIMKYIDTVNTVAESI